MAWPLKLAGLIELEGYVDSMLSYIESAEKEQLVCLATSVTEELGEDTHNNARRALVQALQGLL